MAESLLPATDVSVETDYNGKTTTTISRENKGRKYESYGPDMNEKMKDTIKQIINDPYTAEWLPSSKKD